MNEWVGKRMREVLKVYKQALHARGHMTVLFETKAESTQTKNFIQSLADFFI